MLQLRVNLTLTNRRQINVEAAPGIHPGDLKTLIFATARRDFGEHDEVRIVSVEEVAGPADAPSRVRISKKLERALSLADQRPDLFPASVTLSRRRLYAALTQQGYRWDGQALTWQQTEATHAAQGSAVPHG